MFDKNHSSIVDFLYAFLNFFFVMSIIIAISIMPGFLWLGIKVEGIVFAEIDTSICLLMLYELKSIIGRIMDGKVFVIDNADAFTKVGFYIFLLGIAYMINDIINGNLKILFAFNEEGSLKLDIFDFIIIGCVSLVIGQVLKKATEIKGENDLTI